jgi:hypothetical protein
MPWDDNLYTPVGDKIDPNVYRSASLKYRNVPAFPEQHAGLLRPLKDALQKNGETYADESLFGFHFA